LHQFYPPFLPYKTPIHSLKSPPPSTKIEGLRYKRGHRTTSTRLFLCTQAYYPPSLQRCDGATKARPSFIVPRSSFSELFLLLSFSSVGIFSFYFRYWTIFTRFLHRTGKIKRTTQTTTYQTARRDRI
jgi:hypothetical protein